MTQGQKIADILIKWGYNEENITVYDAEVKIKANNELHHFPLNLLKHMNLKMHLFDDGDLFLTSKKPTKE